MLTFATWNMAKRAAARRELPRLLAKHDIDLLLVQEAGPMTEVPSGYTMIPAGSRRSDTRIVSRFELTPLDPPPLANLGTYATVATTAVGGHEFVVASLHPIARKANGDELAGLDPEVVRRTTVDAPWVNDVAFALLRPIVARRRFIVGADLNTSRLFPGGSEYFERAARVGWVDIVSGTHGEQVPTFLTNRSHLHQLDYLFTDETTADEVVDVVIDTSVTDREGRGFSDHAIVIARTSIRSKGRGL